MGEVINMNSVYQWPLFCPHVIQHTIMLTKMQPTSDRNERPQRNDINYFYDSFFINIL